MKTRIIILVMVALLVLGVVGALEINAGENYTFSIDKTEELEHKIFGNSSDTEGLKIHQDIFGNYSIITLETDYRMKPDSFEIVWYSTKTGEVVTRRGSRNLIDIPRGEITRGGVKEGDEEETILLKSPKQNTFPQWVKSLIGIILVILIITIISIRATKENKSKKGNFSYSNPNFFARFGSGRLPND